MLAPLLSSTSVPVLQIIDHSRLFTPMERPVTQPTSSTIKSSASLANMVSTSGNAQPTTAPVLPPGVMVSASPDHAFISSSSSSSLTLSSMTTPTTEPSNVFHHHHHHHRPDPSRPLFQSSVHPHPTIFQNLEHPAQHVRAHPREKATEDLHSGLAKRFSWGHEPATHAKPHNAPALNDIHMTPTSLSGTSHSSMAPTAFDSNPYPSAPMAAGAFAGHSVISSSSDISPSTTFSPSASPPFYEPPSSTIPTSTVSYSNIAFMSGSNPSLEPPMMLMPMSNPAMMTSYSMTPPVTFSPATQNAIPIGLNHPPEQGNDQLLTLEAGIDVATQGSLAGVREPQKHMSSPESSALGQSSLKMLTANKPEEQRLVPLTASGSSTSTAKYEDDTPKKSHYCNWPNCHKTFTRSAHLARHARSHGGEKPYACPHNGCGKQFARSDVLKEHIRIHDANKIRKRKARDPSDPSKTATASKSITAPAASATPVAPQQTNSQLSAVPPPLTRRSPDDKGTATTEGFPIVPRPSAHALSTPYHSPYHSLQQQPQQPFRQEQYPQHAQYSHPHSTQQFSVQNPGSTFGNQQLNHQGSPFYISTSGLNVGARDVSSGQQLNHGSTNPCAANSPPVFSAPTDGGTATNDMSGAANGTCMETLSSATSGFSGLNYGHTSTRPPLSHMNMNMNNTPMIPPTRAYSMSRVDEIGMVQHQDTPMNPYPGAFGYSQQAAVQQQPPPFGLRERPMSMAALPTYSMSPSIKSSSLGPPPNTHDGTMQGMLASAHMLSPNQDLDDMSQRADKQLSVPMMTVEDLRVTESNLLQRDWGMIP